MVMAIVLIVHSFLPLLKLIMLCRFLLDRLEIWRDKHIEFLTRGLRKLGPQFSVLDAKYVITTLFFLLF